MKVTSIFGTLHIQRKRRNAGRPYKRRNTLDKYYNTRNGFEELKININKFIDIIQKNELLKGIGEEE